MRLRTAEQHSGLCSICSHYMIANNDPRPLELQREVETSYSLWPFARGMAPSTNRIAIHADKVLCDVIGLRRGARGARVALRGWRPMTYALRPLEAS